MVQIKKIVNNITTTEEKKRHKNQANPQVQKNCNLNKSAKNAKKNYIPISLNYILAVFIYRNFFIFFISMLLIHFLYTMCYVSHV